MVRAYKYITIPELAKHLGISRIAVYRKVKKGQIPAKKIGRIYVISSRQVAKILGEELSEPQKRQIDRAVKKVVQEYGETLKWLGRE
jgi:excisionase family DNA binding protein